MTVHTGAEGDVLERYRAQVLAEVVEALENGYAPQAPSTMHPADFITKRFELEGHENLVYRNTEGAVSFTDDELQCLTCAMAGNFPERFEPIRADLLRKLFKAYPYAGGQS